MFCFIELRHFQVDEGYFVTGCVLAMQFGRHDCLMVVALAMGIVIIIEIQDSDNVDCLEWDGCFILWSIFRYREAVFSKIEDVKIYISV